MGDVGRDGEGNDAPAKAAVATDGDGSTVLEGSDASSASIVSCASSASSDAHRSPSANVRAQVCRFLLPVFVPQLLQGKSQTVVQPMLPIFVKEDLHGSNTAVGLISSTYPIAALCTSAALGLVLQRCHYSTSSALSLCVLILTALLSSAAPTVAVFFAIRCMGGIAVAAFDLSRKAYMSAEVPNNVRGRITSLQAGLMKVAVMFAAILSGVVAERVATRSIFFVQAAFTCTAMLAILAHEGSKALLARRSLDAVDAELGVAAGGRGGGRRSGRGASSSAPSIGLRTVARQHWRTILGAGGYCALVNGVRQTWVIALPLQAHSLGLSKEHIGFLVAWFRGIDAFMNLFVTGRIIDRYGRNRAAIPSLLLLAFSYVLLPLSRSAGTLMVAAAVYALGNGLSGGIVNYLATSLAPANARTQFLGLWKTVTSVGGFIFPPLFGVIADSTGSFSVSCSFISGVACFALAWNILFVREGVQDPEALEVVASASALVAASQLEEIPLPRAPSRPDVEQVH
mmetsp:Transcript_33602/g.96413  ORF Transcript_33602/g.96413 Transcript_33602/m.96413 type:complete len:514 (+) Transcript_33602:87-1628(+)